MGVKMNLRIITKNHAADPEIEFLTKSISKPNGLVTAMPTAWELNCVRIRLVNCNFFLILKNFRRIFFPKYTIDFDKNFTKITKTSSHVSFSGHFDVNLEDWLSEIFFQDYDREILGWRAEIV